MAEWIDVIAPYNKIYDTYIDEHEIVQITEKRPELGDIGIIVAGDTNSQFMTFEIDRYYDNIDLSDKLIKFVYVYEVDGKVVINKKTQIYSDDACNICYNDKNVRFSWLLPSAAALEEGRLAVAISFVGQAPAEYELKTTIFELTIAPSINDNSSLEKIVKLTWFDDIESRLYKVEQATGGVDLDYNTLVNKPKINGIELDGDTAITFVKQATQTDLGGVKALPREEDQTQPVGIDEDGFLWVKPSSGGGGGGTGADGFSPIVSMSEEEGGTLLTIVDKNGIKTAHIKNGINGTDGVDGTNGKDGVNGINGVDGFTPVPKIETITEGTRITITKKDGDPEEAVIPNGKDGKDGVDGSSVTVDIDETVEKEHKVIFIDKNGEKEVTIKDGKDGKALIDDAATSGTDVSWSVDKIINYVNKTLEDIENGTY